MRRELVLALDEVEAAEAARIGVVNRVVPAAELEGTIRALAGLASSSDDHQEGLAALFEKRAPKFTGR